MANDTAQIQIAIQTAVSLLSKKGEINFYFNPDLTGEKKSIAFEVYVGPVSYCVEVNTQTNELEFFIGDELVSIEGWSSALNAEKNK